jgi:hypothetical protein
MTMQYTKDSFYLALRDRLAALNPERKVVVDGVERPAVLVVENEPVNAAPPLPNAYYLAWGAPQIVAGSEGSQRPLMKAECRVAYRAASVMAGGVDRGRSLSTLDAEFLRLSTPPRTPKLDATRTPAASLGTYVFWGMPVFDDGGAVAPTGFERAGEENALARTAKLIVFFFSEVEQA